MTEAFNQAAESEEEVPSSARIAAIMALFRADGVSLSAKAKRSLARYHIDTLEEHINNLVVATGFSRKKILKLIGKFPPLAGLDISRVLADFQEVGFSKDKAIKLISQLPQLAGLDIARVKARVRGTRRLEQLLRAEAQKNVQGHPLSDLKEYLENFPAILSYARKRLVFYNRLVIGARLTEKIHRQLITQNPYLVFALFVEESKKGEIDQATVRRVLNIIRWKLSKEEKANLIAEGKAAVARYRAETKDAPRKDRRALFALLARHLDA
ncbi:MAG: hypothetical protein KGJ13_10530 [Patescibacteria group bacterium]|nr:hypothetical protein [Patescibacteria group bacterium]